MTDSQFDQVYPRALRIVSQQHWTPVMVAVRAARLLAAAGKSRIADLGAGSGKFCIVGALTTSARFTGVEQRESLVEVARAAAWRLGARGARFVRANVTDLDFTRFDGFYLYNPFYEQMCSTLPTLPPIDDAIELSPLLYKRYVLATADKLATARVGTAVVTYHGFGGVMPKGYELLHKEPAGNDHLVLWLKRRRRSRALHKA